MCIRDSSNAADMDGYIRELGWREFAYHPVSYTHLDVYKRQG